MTDQSSLATKDEIIEAIDDWSNEITPRLAMYVTEERDALATILQIEVRWRLPTVLLPQQPFGVCMRAAAAMVAHVTGDPGLPVASIRSDYVEDADGQEASVLIRVVTL